MAHTPRHLVEAYHATAPLTVDREVGVIRRVRILGHESKNTHGASGVEATEYPKSAHDSAKPLYENAICFLNHKDTKSKRQVTEAFGRFRNVTTEVTNGQPVTYGDLHYLKSHNEAARVCEDAERGDLGMFGLSHDAYAGKDRIDRSRKRLVIESLAKVNSIDIVLNPATNRNLRESQDEPTMKTLRTLIEDLKDLPVGKAKWAKRLTGDADMRNVCESEGETVGDAFRSAVDTVLSDPTLPANQKAGRVYRLLETQERLEQTADSEPPVPVETPAPTDATLLQENAQLKAELAVRQLCEAESFVAKPHQLKTLRLLESEAERKALIADLKAAVAVPATKPAGPRSGFRVTESNKDELKPADNPKAFAALIRG